MIAVIGCGNLNRRDDGVGPAVVRTLLERGLGGPETTLLDAGTDGMSVMFAARGCTSLIVIDAARTGAEPGAVFEVPGVELSRVHAPGYTLHGFRWNAALHAGRQIFRDAFPEDVVVLLIEAQDLDLGIGLSDTVAASAAIVARRVEALVGARLATAPA